MKEATGELNLTVITIVAIAALVALFYAVVWPGMQASLALNAACSADGNTGTYESGTKSTTDYIKCTTSGTDIKCDFYKKGSSTVTQSKTCGKK